MISTNMTKQELIICNQKPLYRIGDIIVYVDHLYNDPDETNITQSRIIKADAIFDPETETSLLWYYYTEDSIALNGDDEGYICEEDILYKL